MKKLFISSQVALALFSNTLVAEESGAFVGESLGYGSTKYKVKASDEAILMAVYLGDYSLNM